jgi:hypothetical protein
MTRRVVVRDSPGAFSRNPERFLARDLYLVELEPTRGHSSDARDREVDAGSSTTSAHVRSCHVC